MRERKVGRALLPDNRSERTRVTGKSARPTESCIYRGMIRHRRRGSIKNAFKFPAYMMFVDLDDLDWLFRGRWFWSAKRRAIARFDRKDHMKHFSVEKDLKKCVIETLRSHGCEKEIGAVRLLTQFRYLSLIHI